MDLQHPVYPERTHLFPLVAVGADPFERPAPVLHHGDRFGPDTAPGLGIIGLEVDDIELASRLDDPVDDLPLLLRPELLLGLRTMPLKFVHRMSLSREVTTGGSW